MYLNKGSKLLYTVMVLYSFPPLLILPDVAVNLCCCRYAVVLVIVVQNEESLIL